MRRNIIFLAAPSLVFLTACVTSTVSESDIDDSSSQVQVGPASDSEGVQPPVCDTFTQTEAPSVEAINAARAAGNRDYGASEPSDILTRMAEGRNPVTGMMEERAPAISETAFLEEFADVVANADQDSTAPNGFAEFAGPGGVGSLAVEQVEGLWFATSWSIPRQCSPFDFSPGDPQLDHVLNLDLDGKTHS